MSRRLLLALVLTAACGDDSTPDPSTDGGDGGDVGDSSDAPDAPSNLCDTPVAYEAGDEGETIDLGIAAQRAGRLSAEQLPEAVSYTHLTLPTIYSV